MVAAGLQVRLWDSAPRQQIYLGDEAYVDPMQALVDPRRGAGREVPKAQRRRARSLGHWLAQCASREEALCMAYTESGLGMSAIAAEIGLSVSRVSRRTGLARVIGRRD